MKKIEEHELLEERELKERITEILRLVVEEGEAIEITKDGVPIARIVPVSKPKQPVKQELTPFWEKMEQLSAELSAHWPADVSAVDAIRDVRE